MTINPAFAHLLPPTDESALMAFAFRERPVFRMGFDRHVRQWDAAMRRRLWNRYWRVPEFAAAYDARVAEQLEQTRALV